MNVTTEVNPNLNLSSNSTSARIGAYDPAFGLHFNGTLDEVAVYPTALSAAQVQAHYAAATHRKRVRRGRRTVGSRMEHHEDESHEDPGVDGQDEHLPDELSTSQAGTTCLPLDGEQTTEDRHDEVKAQDKHDRSVAPGRGAQRGQGPRDRKGDQHGVVVPVVGHQQAKDRHDGRGQEFLASIMVPDNQIMASPAVPTRPMTSRLDRFVFATIDSNGYCRLIERIALGVRGAGVVYAAGSQAAPGGWPAMSRTRARQQPPS